MVEVMVIAGALVIFAAGFVSWYALWHRRLAASFERVPVRADRHAFVVRDGIVLDTTRSDGRQR